jgi:hypothetical protein
MFASRARLERRSMPLRFGLNSARELFEKLRFDAKEMDKAVNSYAFFNFVVTAYHLIEWVEKDPRIPKAGKKDVPSLRKDKSIAVCRDLANASKHFDLRKDYENQTAKDAVSSQGWGIGRYGHGAWGVGEESIRIELLEGKEIDALVLKEDVLDLWTSFFEKHGLL